MKCCEGNVRGDRGIKGKGGFIPLLFGQNSPVAKLPSQRHLFFSWIKFSSDQTLCKNVLFSNYLHKII